jgi:ferritin-like metal-binding protein YciE
MKTKETKSKTAVARKTNALKTAVKKQGKTSSEASVTEDSSQQKSQEKESLLDKLFVDLLKDMLWAEKHLIDVLSQMQSEATTEQLKDAFEDHQLITQKHISRLEKVFRLLGKEPEEKKCEAMEGLTNEAKNIIKETKENTMTRDAALIIAAQKVEHYEIATYGSLVQLARTMDNEEVASLLEKTLWDEEDTDRLLTEIAEEEINPYADEEPAESMEV